MTISKAAAAANYKINSFSNPKELPSLESTTAIDRQQEESYATLEFSSYGENQYVKCQRCGQAKRIVGKLQRPKNDRIEQIKKRIRHIEEYNLKYNNNKATSDSGGIKELKQELAQLIKEEEKRDRLRSLPLYSSKNTGYKFFCSPCWDQAYLIYEQERKKEKRTNLI